MPGATGIAIEEFSTGGMEVDVVLLAEDNKALTLYVEKDGSLTLNEAKVDADVLRARLEAIRQSNPDVRIYVKGDQDVPYGVMMQIMASVTGAGITQVAFVTSPPRNTPPN